MANEYDPSRAAVLVENLTKWGAADVAVTVGDTARLARYGCDSFDVVAADVPCSGEGMMRKDPRAVAQWTPELVYSSHSQSTLSSFSSLEKVHVL